MEQIDVHEVQANLSRILERPERPERAERGERIIIARAGKPVADLVPHAPSGLEFDILAGRMTVPDDASGWRNTGIDLMFYGAGQAPRHL